MTIYERIKSKRIELGMSQEELAKKVGYIGRSVISKVEAGDRDIKASMVSKYAEALGVSRTWLLTGEEKSPASGEAEQVKELFELIKELTPEEIALVTSMIKGVLSSR